MGGWITRARWSLLGWGAHPSSWSNLSSVSTSITLKIQLAFSNAWEEWWGKQDKNKIFQSLNFHKWRHELYIAVAKEMWEVRMRRKQRNWLHRRWVVTGFGEPFCLLSCYDQFSRVTKAYQSSKNTQSLTHSAENKEKISAVLITLFHFAAHRMRGLFPAIFTATIYHPFLLVPWDNTQSPEFEDSTLKSLK